MRRLHARLDFQCQSSCKVLCLLLLALGRGAGHEGADLAHDEGCTASAEPNDGTVFRDDASPVLFIAVGYCPRAEHARAGAPGGSVKVDLTLEPGGRKFQVCVSVMTHARVQGARRSEKRAAALWAD
jgi:hypothetical protein